MVTRIKTLLLFVLCCTMALATSAQEKTTDTTDTETKSHFKAELNYVNNSVYLGRKDSMLLPYITPSISYCSKSGFYASASVAYATKDKRVDYFSLDAGYDFTIKKNFTASVYGNKTFYNDSSNNVSSDIGASLGTGLAYDFGFVQLHGGADISFAHKTDFGVNFSLDHSFYFGEKDKQWTITPTALLNMSTLNFYEGYTNKTVGKKAIRKNPLILSVNSTTLITNTQTSKLTLMDYELSLPVSYDAKKWGVYFTPTLSIPRNPIYTSTTSVIKFRNPSTPAQTVTTDSTPDSEKKLANTFYAEVGVYLNF